MRNNILVNEIDNSITHIFKFRKKNNRLPTVRELFNIGANLDSISIATDILNSNFRVRKSDINKINWSYVNQKSIKLILKLGTDTHNYTLEKFIMILNFDFITAYLIYECLKLINNEKLSSKIQIFNKMSFKNKSEKKNQEEEISEKIDELALEILLIGKRNKLSEINPYSIAHEMKEGIVFTVKVVEFIRRLLKRETKLPQETKKIIENGVSILPIEDENGNIKDLSDIEKYVRILSIEEEKGNIRDLSDIEKVVRITRLKRLSDVFQVIRYFSERILKNEIDFNNINIPYQETISHQDMLSSELLSEIDNLLEQFKQGEKQKISKKT